MKNSHRRCNAENYKHRMLSENSVKTPVFMRSIHLKFADKRAVPTGCLFSEDCQLFIAIISITELKINDELKMNFLEFLLPNHCFDIISIYYRVRFLVLTLTSTLRRFFINTLASTGLLFSIT